jgi:hypothetical protein
MNRTEIVILDDAAMLGPADTPASFAGLTVAYIPLIQIDHLYISPRLFYPTLCTLTARCRKPVCVRAAGKYHDVHIHTPFVLL